MADSTFHLFQLQKLDLRLAHIAHQMLVFKTKIDDLSSVNSALQELNQAKEKLKEEKLISDSIESKLTAKRIKLAQSESSLYSGKIQNPKELQDLQVEITSLKKGILLLEDSQLENWEKLEFLEADVEIKSIKHNTIKAESNTDIQQMEKEVTHLLNEQQRILLEKNGTMSQISTSFLLTYEKILAIKKGVAVSEIEDACCGVCGTTLTPSECQLAKNHTNIQLCPSCGRVLYAG